MPRAARWGGMKGAAHHLDGARMDIRSQIIRDRRIAAGDEHVSTANRHIYGVGSVARGRGAAGRAFTDRRPEQITTIVLQHQTDGPAFESSTVLSADGSLASAHRIDRIATPFIVTADGVPVYLRDVEFILSNAGGRRGIDIEFCGSFGTSTVPSGPRLRPEQIRAGRRLLKDLVNAIPTIRHIHPHGQVERLAAGSDRAYGVKYHSCSGPDVWVNVGMWATDPRTLGLSTTPAPNTYPDHGISPRQANLAWRQEV
jgi:hypothetical protein